MKIIADLSADPEDSRESRPHVPNDVFVENLIDMVAGALFAPVGPKIATAHGHEAR